MQQESDICSENPEEFQIIKDDPYLVKFQKYYHKLHSLKAQKEQMFKHQNGLSGISQSYKKFGIHKHNGKYIYHQWAPNVQSISIFGDFNNWNRDQYYCKKQQYGHWQCEIEQQIPQFSKIKCQVKLSDNSYVDRIPAWINFTKQNQNKTFDGVYVELGNYKFNHPKPDWENKNVKIYECHVGMSGSQERVHTYTEFKDNVIPRIVDLGYNVIQIMGIMQHPYYGSFGYHVSNFFSVSSRCGKPNQFKALIDEAHKHGVKVIIDIVHSHAAKNVLQGINMWDGTDYQYFHGESKGLHPLWDSRVFDYSKYEVLRFLISNIRFWIQQYNVDGFRFDGVTSMIYTHHGAGYGFTGNYHQYFNEYLDNDALVYLMLANQLAKELYPQVILVAQDVSGFPALCRSVQDGGIGFNYRLAMALPDMWIKFLKEYKDQDWDIQKIAYELTNRRWKEKCITYAQSHDQALVGDKTISMWLFDSETYTNMSVFNEETLRIFRGIALHKMIRLVTFCLGGQGYLNFMGNQFGHPQWIDFPRQGNNWSYHYCRRRWDLATNKMLRFRFLQQFDKAMIHLDTNHNILQAKYQYIRTKDNQKKLLIFEKGNLLFVFNFHHSNSYENCEIYVKSCEYVQVLLSTDDYEFGGHSRVAKQIYQVKVVDPFCGKFKLYVPNRCAIVLQTQNEKQ